MNDIDYQQLIEEANFPKNQIRINNPDAVGRSLNSSCGDAISVEIKFSKDGLKIEEIFWQADGCIVSRASMSILSEMVKGMNKAEIKKLSSEKLLEFLGLESLAPARMKCLTLGLNAIVELL